MTEIYFCSRAQFKKIYRKLNVDNQNKYKELLLFSDEKCWSPKEIVSTKFDKFEKSKNNLKLAICLGYNPAMANKSIDRTNQKLIKMLLEKKYDGYYLVNLYSEITAKANQCHIDEGIRKTNIEFLNDFFSIHKTNDVVIFFGKSATLTKGQYDFIKNIKGRIKYYTSEKNEKQEFIHPAFAKKCCLVGLGELSSIITYNLSAKPKTNTIIDNE